MVKKTCGICHGTLSNSVISLECGHQFHLSCFIETNRYLENKVAKIQKCYHCMKDYDLDIYNILPILKHASLIHLYEHTLRIPRLQCCEKMHNGRQCDQYEYPFNMGYCKRHSLKSMKALYRHEEYGQIMDNLLRLFDVFLLNKYIAYNYLFRLKIFMFVMFYIRYIRKHPDIIFNYGKLHQHFSQMVNEHSSCEKIFTINGIKYPKEELERITFFIKK